MGAIQRFNFTPAETGVLRSVPALSLASLRDPPAGKAALPAAGADSLLVVANANADQMLLGLWDYLAPSGAFAAFSPTVEVCWFNASRSVLMRCSR